MEFKEKLELAKSMISGVMSTKFNYIYPFTTENLNGYMSIYDFKDKSVLTVGSSADQIFNAFVLGSNNITCFDINPFVKEFFNFKKASIKLLSTLEYINFLSSFYNNCFNTNIFNKVVSFIDDSESKEFFMELSKDFTPHKIRKRLFLKDEYHPSVIKSINSYLDYENYLKLKRKIDELNPTFINSDIQDVYKCLTESFDYILLSNISSYLEFIYPNKIYGLKENLESLSKFLKPNGRIFFAYLYHFQINSTYYPYYERIYNLSAVKKIIENTKIISFEGVDSLMFKEGQSKDSVLIYKI